MTRTKQKPRHEAAIPSHRPSCFILTRTKAHQWPGHIHLEHIKHHPCRDRRVMINHLGKINITAPIKSNADLRLAFGISIDPTQQTPTISNTQSTAASHGCRCCNRKQLLSAPIRQPSQKQMYTIHEMCVQDENWWHVMNEFWSEVMLHCLILGYNNNETFHTSVQHSRAFYISHESLVVQQ